MGNEGERFTDRDNLRDASHRAAAPSRTLRAVADGELEPSAELRFSLIQASRDLAEQVRRVTL
jgi:hypothetical protein